MDFDANFQTGQNMKDLLEPNWILERRDSGRLFWRRESCHSTVSDTEDTPRYRPASNRVKFRCDVEVLEFLKQDDIEDDDKWSTDEDDDDDDRWRRKGWNAARYDEEIPSPSVFVGSLCLLFILCVFVFQWLYHSYR